MLLPKSQKQLCRRLDLIFLPGGEHFPDDGSEGCGLLLLEDGKRRLAEAAASGTQALRQRLQILPLQRAVGKPLRRQFLHLYRAVLQAFPQEGAVLCPFFGLQEVSVPGGTLLHIHERAKLRKPFRHFFIQVVPRKAQHAGDHPGIFQRHGDEGEGISRKGAVFVSDEPGGLLQRAKQRAPLRFRIRKIRIFLRRKGLLPVSIGIGAKHGKGHRQAARDPGQKLLVPLPQILLRQSHLIPGAVRAADEQPSQDPPVLFFILQKSAHHPVRIRRLMAACGPEGKIGLQIVRAVQKPASGLRVRQALICQGGASFHRLSVRVPESQTGPGIKGSGDAAETEQIFVDAQLQDPGQGLYASRIRVFQDLLPQSLLQTGREQKLQKAVQKLRLSADDHRADDF